MTRGSGARSRRLLRQETWSYCRDRAPSPRCFLTAAQKTLVQVCDQCYLVRQSKKSCIDGGRVNGPKEREERANDLQQVRMVTLRIGLEWEPIPD